MRSVSVAWIVAAGCFASFGPMAQAESVGFNFVAQGSGQDALSVLAASEDPFGSLYGTRSPGSAEYRNVTVNFAAGATHASYTAKGVTMVVPRYMNAPNGAAGVETGGFYGEWGTALSGASTVFTRASKGGVGVQEPHSSAAFTLGFSGIPPGWASYDIYILTANGHQGTSSLTVTNALSGNVTFGLGAYGWPINFDTPAEIRKSNLNPGGSAAGNWLVATGVRGPSLSLTYSTVNGWKGKISSIQFVRTAADGLLLIVR